MNEVRIFFQQAWLYYKGSNAQFDWEEILFFRIAMPLVTLVYYCTIARVSFRTDYLASWVIGNSILLCINSCVFSLGGSFHAERANGRLKWLVAAPYSRIATVLQKGLFAVLESFFTVALGLIFGSVVFHIPFQGVPIGLFACTVLCGVFAAMCFGMFISMFALVGDGMHMILNLVNLTMMILCGANFPIADLPKWAQALSHLLPFTRSIKAGKLLFGLTDGAQLSALLGEEVLMGLIYLLLSAMLFKVIERVAVKKATLEIF